jgi:hypothetical protein
MARRTKEIVWPHLNDCRGDVGKKWYVEFSVTHSTTGEKVRTRIYDGFESLKTAGERYAYGEKLISTYNGKLASGWRPYDAALSKQYADELKYCGEARIAGRDTVTKSYIHPLLSEYLRWKKPTVKNTSYLDYQSALRQFALYPRTYCSYWSPSVFEANRPAGMTDKFVPLNTPLICVIFVRPAKIFPSIDVIPVPWKQLSIFVDGKSGMPLKMPDGMDAS